MSMAAEGIADTGGLNAAHRTPCKTRFRLAGRAFAGRESNPLDRYERFQFVASSSPGLTLAQ